MPLGTIELRVSEAKYAAFMHDLDDFADFYRLHIVGRPSGLVLNGRPVLVIWFTRDDGLTLLVTDASEPERMQAYFYVAQGGASQDPIPAVMQTYRNKMSGYPRFAEQAPCRPSMRFKPRPTPPWPPPPICARWMRCVVGVLGKSAG